MLIFLINKANPRLGWVVFAMAVIGAVITLNLDSSEPVELRFDHRSDIIRYCHRAGFLQVQKPPAAKEGDVSFYRERDGAIVLVHFANTIPENITLASRYSNHAASLTILPKDSNELELLLKVLKSARYHALNSKSK